MTPANTTPTPSTKSKTSDTYRIVAIAVIVVSSIVVAQLAFALLEDAPGLPGGSGSASLDEADAQGTMYAGLSDLAAVPAADQLAGPAIAAAYTAQAEAQVRAQETFEAAYAEALRSVDGALALIQGGLAEVPTGYAAGADVSSQIVLGPQPDFAVPALPGGIGSLTTAVGDWQDLLSPLEPQEGPALPPTGDPAVDGAIEELLANYRLLTDTLNSPELAPVWGTLQGTPVGGLVSNPAAASSAAAPDERGATVASGHAGTFLTVAGTTYGDLEDRLEAVLAAYEDLADTVAEIQKQAKAATAAVGPMVNAQVAERTAGIKSDVKRLTDQVNAAAAAHAAALGQVNADVIEALTQASEAHAAALQASLEAETVRLEAVAMEVVAETDMRSSEIEARLAYALESLVASQASTGVDVTVEVAQLRAGAADAETRIRAVADSQLAAIAGAVQDLENRTVLAVAQVTVALETVLPAVKAQVDGVLAEIDLAKAYVLAMAKAYGDASVTAAQEKAAATVAAFRSEAIRVSEQALTTALGLTAVAGPAMADGAVLLDRVQTQALDEVGRDLDYIEKVVNDYRAVPTPDRTARAGYWATVHGTTAATLSLVLETGDDLYALAAMVEDAAGDAKAELLAMT